MGNGGQPRDPVLLRARDAVKDAVNAARPCPTESDGQPPRVLVACSGGPDSLALAAVAAWVAPREGWRAGAVIVDHGLQAGSDAVARAAAAQCNDLGLSPVIVKRVDVDPASPDGVEAAARFARYDALAQTAAATRADLVLIGHTMDDQAETVLIALGRGSGLSALAGMAARRDIFARPFLKLRREETRHVCDCLGLTPWDDPTNMPGGPLPSLRAHVRASLIPNAEAILGPGFTPALARTAQDLGAIETLLKKLEEDAFNQAKRPPHAADPTRPIPRAKDQEKDSDFALDTAVLAPQSPPILRGVLHEAAIAWGAAPADLTRAHVLALQALVVDYHGQGPVALPGDVHIERKYGRLEVLQM